MKLQKKGSTIQRAVLLAACSLAVMVFAASCQKQDNSAQQELSKKLETSVAQVNGLTTQIQTLEGKDQGIEGQVAGLNQSLAAVQAGLDDMAKKVGSAGGADAEQRKKIDALSGQVAAATTKANSVTSKIAAVEQKTALLETRYNDHLRKYHSGG